MDVIFNCIHCDQELSVDAAGAGSVIECPTCGGKVTIPQPTEAPAEAVAAPAAAVVASIKTSAAAKEEHHFKVPVRDNAPAESLIARPNKPLDAAAKEGVKIRIKTIRHSECVEVGHDKFDEFVTNYLNKVGQDNIISINTISYEHFDIGTQKVMTDFGVLIVYKG
jgi:DNA-directed RNA polymerase subunit RPC12/RpoP